MGRVTLGVILGMGLVLSGCPAEVGSDLRGEGEEARARQMEVGGRAPDEMGSDLLDAT